MSSGDNAHLDEFLAELSPDELKYIAAASKRMCDSGDKEEAKAEGESMPKEAAENDTYNFED